MTSSTPTSVRTIEKGHESDSVLEKGFDNVAGVPSHAAKWAWLKMDLTILPVISMLYFLSFLDRSNIGNARVAGLEKELHMTDKQYSIALTVTYVPYILIELPSNLLLKRLGPNILLPAMLTLWGIVSTLQGLVQSYHGLIACRFFLGMTEGGLLPGLCLYLASFYPRQQLQLRISIFFASASLAGAFSGLLAAAISHMEGVGGRHGWSWIFILEGLFTVCFGIASFFILPRTPADTAFLTEEEKRYVESTLLADGTMAKVEEDDEFSWFQVGKAFKQVHVLLMGVAGFFSGSTLYALAYFLPTIVASLGYTANHAQLMSVPPYAVSFVLSLVTSFISDHYRCRGLTILVYAIFGIIGFAMFLGSTSSNVRYGAIFLLLPGTYCSAPPLQAWVANNSAPHVRRATALAIYLIMTNSGGILSTWLLGSLSPAPKYTKASITLLIFQIGLFVCTALNMVYLTMRNKEKAIARATGGVDQGEQKGLGDDSVDYDYKL